MNLEKIGIDDFLKVELKTAKVLKCEAVPKSKKLLKFTLDDGTDTERTVVSGIAKWYAPEVLLGKTIVVVANLKPATLCGIESNGMILSAEAPDGKIQLIELGDDIPAGSLLR